MTSTEGAVTDAAARAYARARFGRLRTVADALDRHPGRVLLTALAIAAAALAVHSGVTPLAQVTVNGLVAGAYFALGAAGLTLVYGVLRLINFAHGDMLTFGAYMTLLGTIGLGLPFLVAVLIGVAATAAVALGFEKAIWGPLRRRKAKALQMILAAIGLAFVIRHSIQLVTGTNPRGLGVDVTGSIALAGIRIGKTQLLVLAVGYAVLLALGLMLRYTLLGKQLRALSDDPALAETSGIDTGRLVVVTQLLAGGLAGLAGALFGASIGVITPNVGFFLLLFLFAATILGGIGNAFGALAGGIALGLMQEWSTLLVEARWKAAVGFVILILVLIVRPQGLFGRARVAAR
jgi:neutral amino acid transport system permease protein